MAVQDKMLSLDMGDDDCFYRFRRDREVMSTVVYVHLQTLDILAEDRRTYGPDVVKDLRSVVKGWNDEWTTLTIFREHGVVSYTTDQWTPHSLSADVKLLDLPRLNFLDLDVNHRFNPRVNRIQLGGRSQILKICPFEYQLKYLRRELEAYRVLHERGCNLTPTLLAYVFERDQEQIIGFICEELQGRSAVPTDYEACRHSLMGLHSYGLLHGDINKYNIVITPGGLRFIDLEASILDSDERLSKEEFKQRQRKELDGLHEALNDEGGLGAPWAGY